MFARYAEIMPYYTIGVDFGGTKSFARYAEIMPYYTFLKKQTDSMCLLGMLK